MDIPNEIWIEGMLYKHVKTHPGLFISNLGKMRSYRKVGINNKIGMMSKIPKQINGSPDKDGYLFITRPKIHVHTVVLVSWGIPKPEPHLQVRHLDGNKVNNTLANLCWGTAKENGKDKALHGSSIGSKNPSAKLTEQQVNQMRSIRKDLPLCKIYPMFPQFSEFAIWAAVTGYTWAHLPGAVSGKRSCSKESWRNKQLINESA